MYSKVTQLYIDVDVDVDIFFFMVFSIMVYYRILNIVPYAIQWDLVVYFIYSSSYLLIPNS